MTSPRAQLAAHKIHSSTSLRLTSTNPRSETLGISESSHQASGSKKGKCGYYTSRPHEGRTCTHKPLEMR